MTGCLTDVYGIAVGQNTPHLISRLRCVVDPRTKRVKILSTGLLGDIVECPGRDRVGLWNRYRSNLASVGVLVTKRRVATLAANRDEAVASEG